MRSSWGQKRVKSAKTLKSAQILALFTGNRKKLWSLFDLSQSFENPCRRSSSLVCSCPLWKFPLLIYRRKGGDVHHVVAVGGCRLRQRGISRQFIRRQQRFLFFAKEKKRNSAKKWERGKKKCEQLSFISSADWIMHFFLAFPLRTVILFFKKIFWHYFFVLLPFGKTRHSKCNWTACNDDSPY